MIKFFKDEEGVSAIEYGLIAFFVVVAIVIFLPEISGYVSTLFSTIASAFSG
ncbi:MAG: Flp family type IVb pilin [Pseudomonadota bacterium]